MLQRREFLKQAGLLSALSVMQPGALWAQPAAYKVGIQLYSLREYISKDVSGVLAKVARAGYQEVEPFGYNERDLFWGLTPKAFAAALTANGLTSSSGHYMVDNFFVSGQTDLLKKTIEVAKTCGQTYLVLPHLQEQVRKTPDDFKAVAQKMNQAGALCKAAGLKLSYHNHDFEFKPVNGVVLYDVLLRETDPALVDFEMDLYWIVRGGRDPVQLIEAHPGRFTMWHVKDMDRTNPLRNTEIGSGTIDLVKIFQHAKASGLTHFFMEQEDYTIDAFESITQSATYIKKKLLS